MFSCPKVGGFGFYSVACSLLLGFLSLNCLVKADTGQVELPKKISLNNNDLIVLGGYLGDAKTPYSVRFILQNINSDPNLASELCVSVLIDGVRYFLNNKQIKRVADKGVNLFYVEHGLMIANHTKRNRIFQQLRRLSFLEVRVYMYNKNGSEKELCNGRVHLYKRGPEKK